MSYWPTWSIILTDTENEVEAIKTGLQSKQEVLSWFDCHPDNAPSRYSVVEWNNYTDECTESLNGQEWMDKHTVTETRRRLR